MSGGSRSLKNKASSYDCFKHRKITILKYICQYALKLSLSTSILPALSWKWCPPRQDKVNFNSTPISFDGTPKAKGLSSTDVLQQQEQNFSFKKSVFNNRRYFASLTSTLKTIIYYIYHANSKIHASFSQHFCSQNVQSICY